MRPILTIHDNILSISDDILHTISDDILHSISEKTNIPIDTELVKDMTYYLEKPYCAGLSAVQLGVPIRVIGAKRNYEIIFIVNPEISKHSNQTYRAHEGCLSIGMGKVLYVVKRYKIVTVKGFDLNGKPVSYKSRDLFGAVLQHELDHLDGITINQHGKKL